MCNRRCLFVEVKTTTTTTTNAATITTTTTTTTTITTTTATITTTITIIKEGIYYSLFSSQQQNLQVFFSPSVGGTWHAKLDRIPPMDLGYIRIGQKLIINPIVKFNSQVLHTHLPLTFHLFYQFSYSTRERQILSSINNAQRKYFQSNIVTRLKKTKDKNKDSL
ncbi:hypothetical protein M0802_009070 [Mischocyttarus mexicanus]|nr:hypothetical protein M0802_009070 [Mischocyttarus mexicanus]